MTRFFFRERIVGAICCLLGLAACWLMWHEAGLHQPGRKISVFGDSSKTPFLKGKHPEAPLIFCGIGFTAVLFGLFGMVANRQREQPLWWDLGIGPIFIAVVFGLLLTKARWINGTPVHEIQPGYLLALAATGGLVAVGVSVLVRSCMPRRKRNESVIL